jgi:hypothetical protein
MWVRELYSELLVVVLQVVWVLLLELWAVLLLALLPARLLAR